MASHPKHKKHREEKAAQQKKLQDEEQRKLQEAEQKKKQDLQDKEHKQKLKDVEQQKFQQELEHKKKLQDLEDKKAKQELDKKKAQQEQESDKKKAQQEVEQQKKQLDLEYKQKLQEATKQQASQAVDYDKISDMLAKKLEGNTAQAPQASNPDIDYDKVSEMLAKKLEGKASQDPKAPNADIDYDKLAEIISQNTKKTQVETFSIDYDKLAEMISKNQGKTISSQSSTTEVKDKCKLYMDELQGSLKEIELLSYKNDKKTEEIKETAKLLYTLYQQLYNMQDSYYIFDGSIETYDYKAEVIKKSNNKRYTLLSKAIKDLSTVNVKNAEVSDDINSAIREIKQLAPKEFSDLFNQMYSFIKDHSDMSDIFKSYCSACGSEENLGGNDQLMLFPFCSANMMIGIEAMTAESEF